MTRSSRDAEWIRPHLIPSTVPDDVPAALALAVRLAPVGRTLREDPRTYLATLATLGAADLTTARVVEPHLDAAAILAQAGDPDLDLIGADSGATFGVYAAQAPAAVLRARRAGGAVRLAGTKAWCSLAEQVTHALVTAETESDGRAGLYAVALRHPGVTHARSEWVSRGLAAVTTGTLTLHDVPAVPVGGPGWYLDRPGFAWGGIGVAAVWFGGAVALATRLTEAARRRTPDQVALMHLGHVDRVLYGAGLALRDAAEAIAAGGADGSDGAVLAARVRAVVADAAEDVLRTVGHALGPAPLTHDEDHARRVADLTVYLRQHHAERDLAGLGRLVLGPEAGP